MLLFALAMRLPDPTWYAVFVVSEEVCSTLTLTQVTTRFTEVRRTRHEPTCGLLI